MTPEHRASLRAHLLETGLSGDTRTTRENTVQNARKLADGDHDKHLGLGARNRDLAAVMRAVADLCGCDPSTDVEEGPGVIDPDRTLDALVLLGDRLERAARERPRMIIATGHPTGLAPMYQAIARALAAKGVSVLTPIDGDKVEPPRAHRRRRSIRAFDGVLMLTAGADVVHTHEAWPMEAVLELANPELVLADHGWAGAAVAAGLETLCFTDVNDPAIAVAWADGLMKIVVPLDDNRPPAEYGPLRDSLVARIL